LLESKSSDKRESQLEEKCVCMLELFGIDQNKSYSSKEETKEKEQD